MITNPQHRFGFIALMLKNNKGVPYEILVDPETMQIYINDAKGNPISKSLAAENEIKTIKEEIVKATGSGGLSLSDKIKTLQENITRLQKLCNITINKIQLINPEEHKTNIDVPEGVVVENGIYTNNTPDNQNKSLNTDLVLEKNSVAEATMNENEKNKYFGIYSDDKEYPKYDFGIKLDKDEIEIVEDGVSLGNYGKYNKDDKFKIYLLDDNNIYVLKNDEVLFVKPAKYPQIPKYKVKTELKETASSVKDVTIKKGKSSDIGYDKKEDFNFEDTFHISDKEPTVQNKNMFWFKVLPDGKIEINTYDEKEKKYKPLNPIVRLENVMCKRDTFSLDEYTNLSTEIVKDSNYIIYKIIKRRMNDKLAIVSELIKEDSESKVPYDKRHVRYYNADELIVSEDIFKIEYDEYGTFKKEIFENTKYTDYLKTIDVTK